ncbi:hypothetical protein [uncultured Psychroserpens sp.]|uniref:hypothetical protein n=1 Tax=uncultured Psychroserpens sp. TaxID=255436 RepID=UPI0026270429|nr:hypothetical protein [uncultured Psychroserpens sp.]
MFFILLSCSDKPNAIDNERIIYELNSKYTKFILKHFQDKCNEISDCPDKYNFEKQYVELGKTKSDVGSFRIAFYTNTDSRCCDQFVAKTNRFLKLSETDLIPVVYREDRLYSTDQENCLVSVLGGGKIFYIDEENKTITWVTEM